MPDLVKSYVRRVDALNRWLGLLAMYSVFLMMAILLYTPAKSVLLALLAKTTGETGSFYDAIAPSLYPPVWTLELAQFTMVAYYLLGGAYSMQTESHVRMDLLYSRWQPRTRAVVDAVTVLFLFFYMCLLLYGGLSSTHYALTYGEKGFSAWAPYMAPIKIIMCFGIVLMLLQVIATFFRNIAEARGTPLDGPEALPEREGAP
jgi:TRAP-type mannitol/chloroaromatic compound transport system permease small subunit